MPRVTHSKPARRSLIRSTRPVRMPIGVSDFGKLIRNHYTFVDKSLFIEDILQGSAEVTLITRPRRFGKTLNLSMLQHFFAGKVGGRVTAPLFKILAIAGRRKAMAHQGKYPVIFLSFKDLKSDTYEKCEAALRTLIAKLFRQYPELLKSKKVDSASLRDFKAIGDKKSDFSELTDSVRFLSELLYQHHGKPVVILLDEYDTPIHAAYLNGYYKELMNFMTPFLGAALKDNTALFKGIVTGILKISKESLFSGFNNPDVATVLDKDYSACFGFTEEEASSLLAATKLPAKDSRLEAKIKEWYNGYRFSKDVIYNPWSIINCLNRGGELRSYWVNTSGNDLLKKLIPRADNRFKKGLELLLQGESVEETVDPNIVFADLDSGSTSLSSLLLFSGYLTALSSKPLGSRERCTLAIPNQEIRHVYEDIIQDWLKATFKAEAYQNFLEGVAEGNPEKIEPMLRGFLLRSASFHDTQGEDPEQFYHAIVLGMLAGMGDDYFVRSNRESGLGRYDVAVWPHEGTGRDLGVIFEFKRVADTADLKGAAEKALQQIDARKYETELLGHGVRRILAVGVGFSGKELAMAHEMR